MHRIKHIFPLSLVSAILVISSCYSNYYSGPLIGNWKLVKTYNPRSATWTSDFKGNNSIDFSPVGNEPNGGQYIISENGTSRNSFFTVDSTVDPSRITIRQGSEIYYGIWKIEGNILTLKFSRVPNAPVPKDFGIEPDNEISEFSRL
jgi:hypothetical protein